jgi:hypothetical protein
MTYAIEAPGWEALGWTLIHFCWQAAAIALLYGAADALLGKARSHIRYAAALATLLAMLAAAAATLVYEETRGAEQTLAAQYQAGRMARLVWTDLTGSFDRQSWPTMRGSANAVPAESSVEVLSDSSGAAQASSHGAGWSRLRKEIGAEMRGVMPWLDAIWLFGVLCLSARTVGGWWLLQRLRRTSLLRVPAAVRDSFAMLSLRLGVWWPVDLRISERISSPMAMGVVRSVILLPVSALTSLSPEQLEVVLAHELAHIRRADYLWNMLQTLIETLFFFHPAVWWVSRNLRRQRELCCDDAALECCADPLTYATALLRLEEERGSRLRLAMALDGHESGGLRARIARILGEAPGDGRDIAPFSLLGVCAMLGLLLLPAPRLFADLDLRGKESTAPALASTVALPHASKIAGDPNTDSQPAAPRVPAATAPKPSATIVIAQSEEALPAVPAPAPAPRAQPTPYMVAPAPNPAPQAKPAPEVVAIAPIAPRAESAERALMLMFAPPAPRAMAWAASAAQAASSAAASKGDYIDQMRAAGYDVDLDKYVAMKIQGVTPEFARSMAATGFGKPTADDLIAMKIHGVDPGEVAELKVAGIEPANYQDLITYRIFKVTPEFVAGMKAAGYSNIPAKKLVELRIQNVTPEFAKATKQQWSDATIDQLVQLRIFNINGAFIASAKRHGLQPLTIDKLVQLRISGILDDEPESQNHPEKD